MKKKIMTFATFILVVAGSVLSISANKNHQISLISKSEAKTDPPLQQLWSALCPDGKTVIKVCSTGWDVCTPSGICPGN